MTFEMTNNGLRINLPCNPISQDGMVAILDCENRNGQRLGILLERSSNGQFQRLTNSDLSLLKTRERDDAELLDLYIKVARDPDGESASRLTGILPYQGLRIIHHDSAKPGGLVVFGNYRVAIVGRDVETFHKFVFASHTLRYGKLKQPLFTVFIGLKNNTPTIRCVQGAGTVTDLEADHRQYRSLLEHLSRDDADHALDYYRASLCCGKFVEIQLRKVLQDREIHWSVQVTIEGRPSYEEETHPSLRVPTTCTGIMSLDGTTDELLST